MEIVKLKANFQWIKYYILYTVLFRSPNSQSSPPQDSIFVIKSFETIYVTKYAYDMYLDGLEW